MSTLLPINLPSKCLPYEGIDPTSITIRAYEGQDEVFLAEINPINIEQKFLQVLQNVVVGIDPKLLTLGDRLYIMIWECINSYTETVKLKTMCSHCLQQIEVDIDLRELEVIKLPDDFKQPFERKLPSGKIVNLRLLNIADEIKILNFEKKSPLGLLYRYAHSIVDDENVVERVEMLKKLSAKDMATIRAFQDEFYHGPDMETNIVCPKCGEEDEGVDVPFRLDFLFPIGETLRNTFGTRV